MLKLFISTALTLLLTGCIIGNSAPRENFEFLQTTDLQQFTGVYKNAGDPSGYLSKLIWKGSHIFDTYGKNVPHQEIELIGVSSFDNALAVNAIKGGCVVHSQTYVLDRDFTVRNGKIVLKYESNFLSRGSGDVLVGPSFEKIELGLDVKGNGKYKSQTYFAGLVFLFLPIAGGGTEELKFEKLSRSTPFDLCKPVN